MSSQDRRAYIYVGLAGEGEHIGEGGLYRAGDGDYDWEPIGEGLPPNPQVRSLLLQPDNPKVVHAGTQLGVYRSDDGGDHWEALERPRAGIDVWSLARHPRDPNVIYAGYEPCAIHRSEDGGETWEDMDTSEVRFPHVTTYMPPLAKRVIGIASDPSDPSDVYAAVEVGGLLASRDGGETWASITDGLYTRNNTVDLHGVQVSKAAPGTVYIITQVATFVSRDRGQRWEHVRVEEMFQGGSYCRDLLVAPDDPNTIYLAASAGGGGAPPGTEEAGALFRSRDLGESWQQVDLGETPASRTFRVAVDPAAPSHIHCATRDAQVFSSHDGGSSWSSSRLPGEMSRSRHVYSMVCG